MTPINTVGLIAAILTTSAFLPQVIKVLVTRETKALSLIMYIVLTIGIALWLVYGILRADIPVVAANGTTLLLSLIILIVKISNKD